MTVTFEEFSPTHDFFDYTGGKEARSRESPATDNGKAPHRSGIQFPEAD